MYELRYKLLSEYGFGFLDPITNDFSRTLDLLLQIFITWRIPSNTTGWFNPILRLYKICMKNIVQKKLRS